MVVLYLEVLTAGHPHDHRQQRLELARLVLVLIPLVPLPAARAVRLPLHDLAVQDAEGSVAGAHTLLPQPVAVVGDDVGG
jgi:hypothetical protein